MSLPGESISSSWDRFNAFIRSVLNHHIDNDSLKVFLQGQDEKSKSVLETISRARMEISHLSKSQRCQRRSPKTINLREYLQGNNYTFAVQATSNQSRDNLHEEMGHMETELGLVLRMWAEVLKSKCSVWFDKNSTTCWDVLFCRRCLCGRW